MNRVLVVEEDVLESSLYPEFFQEVVSPEEAKEVSSLPEPLRYLSENLP